MPYQLNNLIYRVEHGLTAAEQRAADQRMGEFAATLAGLRRSVAGSLGLALGALRGLGRPKRTRQDATSRLTAPTGH